MSVKNIVRQTISLLSQSIRIKDIILLESISDFSDNTYALFQEMLDAKLNGRFKIIWLIKNEDNLEAIHNIPNVSVFNVTKGNKLIRELQLFKLYSSARYVFFSHSLYSKTLPKKGQDIVFLTHGVHFKNGEGRYFDMNKITNLITVSKNDNSIAHRVYNVAEDKLKVLGYPRNDYLLTPNPQVKQKISEYLETQDNKLIFWLPTFRRHSNKLTNDSKLNVDQSDLPLLKTNDDFKELNEILKENNQILVIKPHPSQDMTVFETVELSHIKLLTNSDLLKMNIQLYQALALADVLITDYSSVFIDYLLTDRPIVFTTDDLEAYGENLGFMLDDYQDYMPGAKVANLDNLIEVIRNDFNESKELAEHRFKVKDFFHSYKDNKSGKRIIEEFFKS